MCGRSRRRVRKRSHVAFVDRRAHRLWLLQVSRRSVPHHVREPNRLHARRRLYVRAHVHAVHPATEHRRRMRMRCGRRPWHAIQRCVSTRALTQLRREPLFPAGESAEEYDDSTLNSSMSNTSRCASTSSFLMANGASRCGRNARREIGAPFLRRRVALPSSRQSVLRSMFESSMRAPRRRSNQPLFLSRMGAPSPVG